MKPEKKTWQDVAAGTAVDSFLRLLDAGIERLQREIADIYPELGKQCYRYRDTLKDGFKGAWPVEEKLIEIGRKDDEITRLSQLRDAIIHEIRKQAEVA